MDVDHAWFRLDADGLGKETKKPREAPRPYELVKPYFWKMPLTDGLLFTNRKGLWRRRGATTTKIASGNVGYPTVAPDWLFFSWKDRLFWMDRTEFRFRRVSEDGLALLRWLPARKAALVWRESNEEHFLLDPATGGLESVDGDFQPFHVHGATAPRKGAGFFFVRNTEDGAQICSYDTRTFRYRVLRTLPLSHLDDIHVDEEANLLYVVHEGLLLRTRLRE